MLIEARDGAWRAVCRVRYSACFDEATRGRRILRFLDSATLRESQVCECMCVSGLVFENTTALSPRQDLPCSIVLFHSLPSALSQLSIRYCSRPLR